MKVVKLPRLRDDDKSVNDITSVWFAFPAGTFPLDHFTDIGVPLFWKTVGIEALPVWLIIIVIVMALNSPIP